MSAASQASPTTAGLDERFAENRHLLAGPAVVAPFGFAQDGHGGREAGAVVRLYAVAGTYVDQKIATVGKDI
jgi:hypothetical protein